MNLSVKISDMSDGMSYSRLFRNQSGISSFRSTNSAMENATYRREALELKYHNDGLILVKDTDPHKLMFDSTSICKLRNKKSSTLKLVSSHNDVGKAFCYIPETKSFDWSEGFQFRSCIANVNDDDNETFELTWKYDGKCLSTDTPDGNEWVLDVRDWKLVDRRGLGIVRIQGGDSKDGTGRAFILRDDGSISLRDEPSLFLGRRGDVIAVDEMRFIQSFRDAIHDGDDDEAKDVITKGAANVNKVIEGVDTSILGEACKSDARCGIVKVLLEEFGADPNLEVDHTPLCLAGVFGCTEIVKVLLQHGANPNQINIDGTPPIACTAYNGHLEIIQLLLNESSNDVPVCINRGPNTAVFTAVHNNQDECLKFLLKNGAEASLDIKDPWWKEFPLQHACKKGLVKGLPLVTAILESYGDLRIDRVEELKDPTSTDVLIKAYTTLSNKLLSRCISRALLKYDYDRETTSNYPESGNPLLSCIRLAKVVREKWRQVRRSDPNYCNALNKLFSNLQLGGAHILEEMYKDQHERDWVGGSYVVKSKEENLSLFLNNESSRSAIEIAHDIQSRIFFNQPIVYNYINRQWYGTDVMQEIFLDQKKDNFEAFMQMIGFVGLLFLNLVPLLLQGTPLSPLLQHISKSQMSMRFFCLKSKDPWLFTSPVVIFVVQCVFDLGLALMFTFIDANDPVTICINNDCNVTMNRIVPWLILFFTLGILSWEMRDMIGNLSATSRTKDSRFFGIFFHIPSALRDYFRIDPFNFFDFPASLLASLSLGLGLCGVSGGGIITMQSLGCILLWLRLLRVLTLHPNAGSLVLMFFKMVNMIILWLSILVVIVFAFASGVYKLSFASGIDPTYGNLYSENEEKCELVSRNVMFKQFFEDAISGGGSALLDCYDTSSPGKIFGLVSYGNFIIYLVILICQLLLVNMLIAMMNEAFSTIFDAQEANFTYQRATHFLEITDDDSKHGKAKRYIQVFYFPYGLYEIGRFCFKRFSTRDFELVNQTGKDREFGDESLDEVTTLFYDYICEHQDEATEDDRWRLHVMKKITDLKLEQERFDEKFEEQNKRFEEQNERFDKLDEKFKELESLVEHKFDKLLKVMEQVLEKES